MKLMIASDLHGSAYYTRLLLTVMDREQPDRLLLLGDLLYHGPRNDLPREYAPKQVIQLLNARKSQILCVRGNCEAEVDQMVLEFPVLSEFGVVFADGLTLYMLHGHKNLDIPVLPGDILLCGQPMFRRCGRTGNIIMSTPVPCPSPRRGAATGI